MHAQHDAARIRRPVPRSPTSLGRVTAHVSMALPQPAVLHIAAYVDERR